MKTELQSVFEDLPLEEGKTYPLKMTAGGDFTITGIDRNKDGVPVHLWGIYGDSPHLGICPLGVSRVKPERVFIGEVSVCGNCKTEIE